MAPRHETREHDTCERCRLHGEASGDEMLLNLLYCCSTRNNADESSPSVPLPSRISTEGCPKMSCKDTVVQLRFKTTGYLSIRNANKEDCRRRCRWHGTTTNYLRFLSMTLRFSGTPLSCAEHSTYARGWMYQVYLLHTSTYTRYLTQWYLYLYLVQVPGMYHVPGMIPGNGSTLPGMYQVQVLP